MSKPNFRPGDLTGRAKAELAEQHAEEQKARANEIALVTAQAAAKFDEVQDLVPKTPEPEAEPEAQVVGDIEVATSVEVKEELVEFRTNDTFSATIGHGNDFDFVEGQKIRAPKWIYDHLDSKGLVWH
jgi:UDP-N-acetyl-D-mannosaminuronic acid transferase (WecB/TagA/CpsF family)